MLNFVLFNLPPETACISIKATFPKQKEEDPPSGLNSELNQLTRLIKSVTPDTETANELISYEFVVLPPNIPEEAREQIGTSSFGSAVRSASSLVRETLKHGRLAGIHTLDIKPHGYPEGIAGIPALRAQNFRVPIRFVEAINLLEEKKPLTPWVEVKKGMPEINPIEYPSP